MSRHTRITTEKKPDKYEQLAINAAKLAEDMKKTAEDLSKKVDSAKSARESREAQASARKAELARIAAERAATAARMEQIRQDAAKRAQDAAKRAQDRAERTKSKTPVERPSVLTQVSAEALKRDLELGRLPPREVVKRFPSGEIKDTYTRTKLPETKPVTIEDIRRGVNEIGPAYERIFTSVTDSLDKASKKALKGSVDLALKGNPVAGFGSYAIGTAIRTAKGGVEAVTLPIRPAAWAKTADAIGLLLMPEKGESYADYRKRINSMVTGEKAGELDSATRTKIENYLLTTLPPSPISQKDIKAGKEFRAAVAQTIAEDPVGFLAEVAGGVAGGVLLSKALGKLTTGRVKTVDMTQTEYLEYLESHPWSGGMATSQESTWWLDQVVDDLVKRTKPGYAKSRLTGKAGWRSSLKALRDARTALARSAKGGTGTLKIPVSIPPIDISPWAVALLTPGALNYLRDELRDRGLTDEQIDNLLVDVGRSEELTTSGGEGVTIYQPAEWTRLVPETYLPGYTPKPEPPKPKPDQPDPTKPGYKPPPEEEKQDQPTPTVLDQPTPTVPDEPAPPVPDEPEPPQPDEPGPRPPKKPKEPTKPEPTEEGGADGSKKIPGKLKKKGDPGSRPNVFHALIGGIKEEYRVVFDYPKGPSETFTVTARSFPQALSQAQQKRRVKRWAPSEIDIAKTSKPTKKKASG